MDRQYPTTHVDLPARARGLSRRTLLRGAAVTGLGGAAAALLGRTGRIAHAGPATAQTAAWQQFDDTVQAAMQTFDMVGAAVAVVNADGIVHSNTFGVRNLTSRAPVTPNTLFRVGSTTKSMTALLVATFVDEGLLGWDQPVVDVWPDFRAPNAALTSSLRVRDLMGMATGLGEGWFALHYDYPTALQLMQGFAYLPVLTPPHTEWYYNNAVYAAAGYMPPLRQGVAADDLQSAYTRLMQERVFGPAGMVGAHIGDDPRPYTADYATGYNPDFVEGIAVGNATPIGSVGPAGGGLVNLTDMAAYVRLQLRRGVSSAGTHVVTSRNLEECWRPQIVVPVGPADGPDVMSAGYGMGWIDYTYTNNVRLVWHTGFWDGFGAFIGFFPEKDLGLVVLMNTLATSSESFYHYVLNLLLERRFSLNRGVNETVVAAYQDAAGARTALAAQARPVDAGVIAPFLGDYEHGDRLAYDAAGVLRLYAGGRAMRVLALPDGSYVLASGQAVGLPLRLVRDQMGTPVMELEGTETVRWLSGPP
ncbi:MAG: serine hydrolase domain-containing protein [Dehalococcoidia bacterium]